MARIRKSTLTKLEIMQESSRQFLEKGYTATSISSISKALGMSPGNLTFYYPTKEHLLADLVDIMCRFQWKLLEAVADKSAGPVLSPCLEVYSMVSAGEDDPVIKDFFLSAYTSPICLEIIRRNDREKNRQIFQSYCPDWTDEQFAEAEILCSGIEYAALMTTNDPVSSEECISGAVNTILGIYGVPREVRQETLKKVFAIDRKQLGKQVLLEFKRFVEQANEQALLDLLKH